jgi:GntR family carbon starvation induced transcriptional regulator
MKDSAQSVSSFDGDTSELTTQRVYHEMRTRIIQCEIAPGEKLKIKSLKVMLNAGATPIHEALSLLTSDQLVERIGQRGFIAASASEANLQEIIMLRS